MTKYEKVELTVLCMIYEKDKLLLQLRNKKDWQGMTFPGGHVEKGESIVQAVIREMKEETGLEIYKPCLCGIEQFQVENDVRYLIFLFKTNKFSGELVSSAEGCMSWVNRDEINQLPLVSNFKDLLYIFDNDEFNELYYSIIDEKTWIPLYK